MIDQLCRKSSSSPQQERHGAADGISHRPTIRWLNVFTAISSVALFSVAGTWTVADGAFADGAGLIARRLTFDASANSGVDGGEPFAASRSFSQPAVTGEVQSALLLTGISGEALAASPLADAQTRSSASPRLPLATPVNFSALPVAANFVADRITVAAANLAAPHHLTTTPTSLNTARPQEVWPEAARPAGAAFDPNAPVPDYALVFSRQPTAGNEASLQAVSLRAEWRAVIEPLIMNAEPKPAVVDNL